MGSRAFELARRLQLCRVSGLRPRGRQSRPLQRMPESAHPLPRSMALISAVTSQCPKSIAPIVKTAAPIQMTTAALRSDMVGPFRMAR